MKNKDDTEVYNVCSIFEEVGGITCSNTCHVHVRNVQPVSGTVAQVTDSCLFV